MLFFSQYLYHPSVCVWYFFYFTLVRFWKIILGPRLSTVLGESSSLGRRNVFGDTWNFSRCYGETLYSHKKSKMFNDSGIEVDFHSTHRLDHPHSAILIETKYSRVDQEKIVEYSL